jgi:FTR1 family protein
MITTAIISFREFFEAFLLVGVFLGISRRLKLKKELEIWVAVIVGVFLSLSLSFGTYLLGDRIRGIFTESNADLLGGYLMIFSGIFIAYVVFSLHDFLQKSRSNDLIKTHDKLKQSAFDISLFFTIVFLVLREGFEIALFTIGFSLFSDFMQNFMGVIIGLILSILFGLVTLYLYEKFAIEKVFKATEYVIILMGAALAQRGVTELVSRYTNVDLSSVLSFNLTFLPDHESFMGHIWQGFFGVDQDFSFARLSIMLIYFAIIYLIFLKKKT